jgi:hypothetical protein
MTPKTRDEILADLRCELRGLLLESFSEAKRMGDFVRDGQVMTRQMHRANSLFDRIVAAAAPMEPLAPKPEPSKNGLPAKTVGT